MQSYFDSDCVVVHLFKDEEIKDAKNRDPDLSWFIDLFNEHTEKPQAKSLAGKSSEVNNLVFTLDTIQNCGQNLVWSR